MTQDTRPTFIVPYFGKLPVWMPAYLLSCEMNPDYRWLFFTDDKHPAYLPENVIFFSMTLAELNSLASERLGVRISLSRPYKVCDLKPAYGMVFREWLHDCSFWGYCDTDVIWGRLGHFFPASILESIDIASGGYNKVLGHFILMRNKAPLDRLFQRIPCYYEKLNENESFFLDEPALTSIVHEALNQGELRVAWDKWLYNYPLPNKDNLTPSKIPFFGKHWDWEQGRLLFHHSEIMYLHFMTWKDTLIHCNFNYGDHPKSFSIHYYGINNSDIRFPLDKRLLSLQTAAWRTVRRALSWRIEYILKKISKKP